MRFLLVRVSMSRVPPMRYLPCSHGLLAARVAVGFNCLAARAVARRSVPGDRKPVPCVQTSAPCLGIQRVGTGPVTRGFILVVSLHCFGSTMC